MTIYKGYFEQQSMRMYRKEEPYQRSYALETFELDPVLTWSKFFPSNRYYKKILYGYIQVIFPSELSVMPWPCLGVLLFLQSRQDSQFVDMMLINKELPEAYDKKK